MTIAHFILTLVVVVVCIWARSTYVVVHKRALGTYTKWLQNSHEFVYTGTNIHTHIYSLVSMYVHECVYVCVYVCACVCAFLHRLFHQLTTHVAI